MYQKNKGMKPTRFIPLFFDSAYINVVVHNFKKNHRLTINFFYGIVSYDLLIDGGVYIVTKI